VTETTTPTAPEIPEAPAGGPLSTAEMPAGYRVDYFVEPTRKYEIDGVEVPSVTTILGCLDKPGLPWWGMDMGVQGVLRLMLEHKYQIAEWAQRMQAEGLEADGMSESILKLLTEHKMTVNHVRDKAGDRGTRAHNAFEAWAGLGEIPDISDWPLEEQGYGRALLAFIADVGDGIVFDELEVMVGSKEHGFAGRFDARGYTTKELRLVTSALTTKNEIRKRGPKYTTVPAGIKLLGDVKTSKGIYGTHLLQLEGYEGASIEAGYEPTDARVVIHLTMHGLYEFKRARATYEDFLAILHTYHALQRVEEALKA
jgi:hypothetical protein